MIAQEAPARTPVWDAGGGLHVKRDDLALTGGLALGSKGRAAWAMSRGAAGLVTAGGRHSRQIVVVAQVAQWRGVPCQLHVPAGATTQEIERAAELGAVIVAHRPGYSSVLASRAQAAAREQGWLYLRPGLEGPEIVLQVAQQVPPAMFALDIRRIVVPVGSGMTLAGVLAGSATQHTPVLGVLVGGWRDHHLEAVLPPSWVDDWRSRLTLVQSDLAYDQPAPTSRLAAATWVAQLDEFYEAKCLPYLQPGDLLWLAGLGHAAAGAGKVLRWPRDLEVLP